MTRQSIGGELKQHTESFYPPHLQSTHKQDPKPAPAPVPLSLQVTAVLLPCLSEGQIHR